IGLALLKQQVVSLDNDFVTGFKPADDFDSIITLDPEGNRSSFKAGTSRDIHDRLTGVGQQSRLRNRDGGAVHIRNYFHIGKHIGFESAVAVLNFRANLDAASLGVNYRGNQ